MDEFLAGYYGPSAAPHLAQFIALVEAGPRKTKTSVGCGHSGAPFLTAPDKLKAAEIMNAAVAAAARDGAQYAARVRRERLSVDHCLLLHYDVLRDFAKEKNLPWTRPATRAEAAANWVREIRAQGVRAYRETTTEATLENYLSKLLSAETLARER